MMYVIVALAVAALIGAFLWATGGYRQFERTLNDRPQDLRRAGDDDRQVPHTHVTRTPLQ